jgi:hypothetical protein
MIYFGNQRNHTPAVRRRAALRRLLPALFLLLVTTGSGVAAAAIFMGPRATAAGLVESLTGRTERDVRERDARLKMNAQKAEAVAETAFRISQASEAGADRDAGFPDVAYNPEDNEYMVVWEGDGLSGADFRRVKEIFGQRINAATGAEIGPDFLISRMSDRGHTQVANETQVVYNTTAHEYMVVWHGTGAVGDPDDVFEVYGQRLDRKGIEIGKDFRISHLTDLGKVQETIVRQAAHAHVAWNSTGNQYLVVWEGMGQPEGALKAEIYGQLLSAKGESVGKNFRISNTTDQGLGFNASGPDVAFNSTNNRYIVVWAGGFKEQNQSEIWAQGLTAQGTQAGEGNGDFRISQITTAVGANRDAGAPRVLYNKSNNEYLLVFQATGVPGPSNDRLSEIFGQRLDAATLKETGPDDFRISHTVGPKNVADNPRVAYNASDKEYLVIWRGVRDVGPFEIFGQRVSIAGAEVGPDFQISNIEAAGKDRKVNLAATACAANGECLAVWQGDGLVGPNSRRVNEIFGLRMRPSSKRRP